jgi:flagellar FliJ protein
MRKFSFKLKRLQEVRERNEEAALLRLSLARTDLAREEKLLASLAGAVENSGARLVELVADGSSADMLRNADAFRQAMAVAVEHQKEAANKAGRYAGEKREEFRRAHQEAEVIRKLHERRREEHRKESLRETQKELDEIGSTKTKVARASSGV